MPQSRWLDGPRAGGLTDRVVALGDVRGPTGGLREQLLDMVIAVSAIRGDAGYLEPILRAAFDGMRRPAMCTSTDF